MDVRYRWNFSAPGKMLGIQMENRNPGEAQPFFDATLSLRKTALTPFHIARVFALRPLQTFRVMFLIYWQAFKLGCKRVPFYSHPPKASVFQEENK